MRFLFRFIVLVVISGTAQADRILRNLTYGVELSRQEMTFKTDVPGALAEDTNTASGFAIFAEKYYRRKYRYSGRIGVASYTDNKVMDITLSADYIYPLHSRLALTAGLAAGGVGQKYEGSSTSDMALGLLYGGQFGVVLFVNKSLTINLGYRLRQTNLETNIAGSSSIITTTQLNESYMDFIISF